MRSAVWKKNMSLTYNFDHDRFLNPKFDTKQAKFLTKKIHLLIWNWFIRPSYYIEMCDHCCILASSVLFCSWPITTWIIWYYCFCSWVNKYRNHTWYIYCLYHLSTVCWWTPKQIYLIYVKHLMLYNWSKYYTMCDIYYMLIGALFLYLTRSLLSYKISIF